MLRRVTIDIRDNGAIIVDGVLSIDGFSETSMFHGVTHIHSDHIRGLRKSISKRKTIIATPITIGMLEALGYPINRSRVVELDYGEKYEYNDFAIRLERTNHIPGSSMVVYETNDCLVAYTGDFKLPGTYTPQEPDILIIDATYGREEWRRPWQLEVEIILADIVLEGLSRGPVNIYAYNGKIQEVMMLLRKHGVIAPFIAPLKPYLLAKTLEKYGHNIGELYYEYERKAQEIIRDGWYVLFLEAKEWRKRREYRRIDGRRTTHILLTGWEFTDSFRKLSADEWIVSFSDHADFDQLVEYVSNTKPRQVIVDASRAGETAHWFAKYIEKVFKIPSIALPANLSS